MNVSCIACGVQIRKPTLTSIMAVFTVAFEEIEKYRPTLLSEMIKNILRILPALPLPQYRKSR